MGRSGRRGPSYCGDRAHGGMGVTRGEENGGEILGEENQEPKKTLAIWDVT